MNSSEAIILKTLLDWDHKKTRSTAFRIAMVTGYTLGHTFQVLRKFIEMFWIVRNKYGSSTYYMINPKQRKQHMKRLKAIK